MKNCLTIVLTLLLCYSLAMPARAQQSLYSDVKAHRPGDVITIILTENISGSSTTNARSASNTNGSTEGSMKSNFLPFDPVFGGDTEVNYNSDERITADQSQLLQGSFSVQVQEVNQNGNLLVEGNRRTEINGELHEMSISGYVRPTDINDANQVLSYRIADAEITYLKKEGLRQHRNKTGIGRKIIWGLVGIATGAAAIMVNN
ncbi:flagellar basal body L-ring protein FlgH [Fodinibius sediminis]|uniref:Flagellar L-ring protein FlgH n=1 Tax=Fodinibius sediminis TaxID=1214077 RepID=A0A521CHK2_9BACT|nr:flagellar basal body L-ring protein FlgH [Fodinibius sediminis]SMO58892.1 flagellar L-ring protein precursor FlgH [Fodinibius sediminis]